MTRLDIRTLPELDPLVVADTSVLIAAYVSREAEPKNDIARSFLRHARNQFLLGQSQLFVADLVVEEAAFVIVREGLKADVDSDTYPEVRREWERRNKNRQFGWQELYKSYSGASVMHVGKVRQFLTDIRPFPVEIVEPDLLGISGAQLMDLMSNAWRGTRCSRLTAITSQWPQHLELPCSLHWIMIGSVPTQISLY